MNSKKSSPFSYCKYAFVLPLVFTLMLIVNQPFDGLANNVSVETTNAINFLGDSETSNTETIITPIEVISDSSNNTEKQTSLNLSKSDGHKSIVRLLESKRDTIKNFELYQNVPNPFRNKTVIGFNLPKATSATLTVWDVEGKIVKTVNGDFEKGFNEIKLHKSDLVVDSKYPGVLYYQLDCEKFTKTRKMILIEKK